jgi:hypothetical protein
MHRAVEYGPITRYDVAGGYLNLAGLADHARSISTGRT